MPQGMREQVKKDIHISHNGVEGCLRRARECVYWPCMNSEIRHWISTCEPCRQFEVSQGKETLMSHEIPERPWEKVGIDIFTLSNNDYLVTVDYYSNFWELDRLENTSSRNVIRKLKSHFTRYGSPTQLISDNGSQFISVEFQKFTREWDIEHHTVSPYNSKANGKAEAAVKSAKCLLRKTAKGGEDQYLALLAHRNTPTQGVGSSPAQRLMNRRTRTLLPTVTTLLEPRTISKGHERERMKDQQQRQAYYYNRSARDLPPLKEGETVRMKPFVLGQKHWKKAVVARRLDHRSYEVDTGGTIYRRNRAHLRCSHEPTPSEDIGPISPTVEPHTIPHTERYSGDQEDPNVTQAQTRSPTKDQSRGSMERPQGSSEVQVHPEGGKNTQVGSEAEPQPQEGNNEAGTNLNHTRSGRTVKRPDRFKDFVSCVFMA